MKHPEYVLRQQQVDDVIGCLSWDDGGDHLPRIHERENMAVSESDRRLVTDIILGRTRRHDRGLEAYLRKYAPLIGGGRITAELVAWAGLSIIAMAAFAHRKGGAIEIRMAGSDGLAARAVPGSNHGVDQVALMNARVGGGLTWTSHGGLFMDRRRITLPETVITGSVGAKLAGIVSHPVLDGHDLVVREVLSYSEGIELRFGETTGDVSVEDLIMIWRDAKAAATGKIKETVG